MSFDDDVTSLTAACLDVLGPTDTWTAPAGYPDSLALCVIDAVWSMGVRYGGVRRVIARYLAAQSDEGQDGNSDDVRDLVDHIARTGGPGAFAVAMDNRGRTSTRSGILKADAVARCAGALLREGIDSAVDLRHATGLAADAAETAWRSVPGQRSGISWRYVRLLAGLADVKPDRMITRFVSAATSSTPSPTEAADLVTAVAQHLDADLRGLDHRIWRFQSGRG